MRRVALGIILLLSIGVTIVWAATRKEELPTAELLFPADPALTLLWPNQLSYVWQINAFDSAEASEMFSVVVRVKSGIKHPFVMYAEDRKQRIMREDAEQELVMSGLAGSELPDEMRVAIQAVDLAEGQVASAHPGSSLRLLVRLAAGSGSTYNYRERCVIEGKGFAGNYTFQKPEWQDGELHLHTFYVTADESVTAYNVFLTHRKQL